MKLTQAAFEDAREFQKIQKFIAACRQQWPGAKIVLRPNEDDASSGADAVRLCPRNRTRSRYPCQNSITIC